MTTTAHEAAALDTMDAAASWLQRIDAPAEAVAVVNVRPTAWLGTWQPGTDSVRRRATIDDPGAELCEAVAPVVQHALGLQSYEARIGINDALEAGGRLQLLIAPSAGEIALRLLKGGAAVVVATVRLEP